MKKNIIKTALIFLIGFFCQFAHAQSNGGEAQYKYGYKALHDFLSHELEKACKKVNTLDGCLISVTFAKFKIDSVGNINSISFSETNNTPTIYREMLSSILKETNGNWVPRFINGKATESRPFVLPLIYQMEAGCQGKEANNGTDTALLQFSEDSTGIGPNMSALDCVFLKPLRIFSAR